MELSGALRWAGLCQEVAGRAVIMMCCSLGELGVCSSRAAAMQRAAVVQTKCRARNSSGAGVECDRLGKGAAG